MSTPPNSDRRKKIFIILASVLGVVVVAAVIFLLWPRPTPEEVARQWAANNADAAGERVAEFILEALGKDGGLQGKIFKEVGGEWIEDRINEHLVWQFSPAASNGDGSHNVTATARVDFQVNQPPISGGIRAQLPFRLLIQGSSVVEENVVLADAGFEATLEGIDTGLNPASIDVDTEKAVEAVTEAADKLKGLLGQ